MNIDFGPDSVLANRYRIVEKIGKGGMAEVFRGVDHVLEREVAVKVLTERSDDVCRRFLLEAQSMARLNHPNIVAVYDVGVDRNLSYIILEFVRGSTMRDIDRKKISFDASLTLTIQLLEALQYAHGQGIIHRDIKPGNLMIGDDKTLKVMDFGLARRMSDMSNLTQSGEIVGTIAYLPPERFLGKSGDKSSDLYSVGVLMYELLCGTLPFPHESGDLVAVMYAHVNDRPRPPRLLNPLIPPALDRIIMRLLEKEPARRYGDAASLIADLRAVQSSLIRQAAKALKDSPAAEPRGTASDGRNGRHPDCRQRFQENKRRARCICRPLNRRVSQERLGDEQDVHERTQSRHARHDERPQAAMARSRRSLCCRSGHVDAASPSLRAGAHLRPPGRHVLREDEGDRGRIAKRSHRSPRVPHQSSARLA